MGNNKAKVETSASREERQQQPVGRKEVSGGQLRTNYDTQMHSLYVNLKLVLMY